MKEQAIQKINKIGKISSIFALIAKILVGIGLVLTIVGAVACFMIPRDLVNVTTAGTMEVEMDLSSIGIVASQEEQEAMMASLQGELEDGEEELAVIDVTENKIVFGGEMEKETLSMRDAGWAIVMAAIMMIMTFVTLCFVSALCKAFRDCQSPFEENVIKKMQNLAISLIPWCVVSSVADSIFDSIINRKPSISITVDLGIVLIVLVVLVLVYIFKYGAVLQQESDETL